MTQNLSASEPGLVASPEWVDELLLSGPDNEVCLCSDEPVDRGTLRRLVSRRQSTLVAAGLRAGGTLALRLPPSMAYVANLLAGWRIGAQVILLDHRLTSFEVDAALNRLAPQVVVAAERTRGGALRAFADVDESVTPWPGRPATTPHAVIQLSSGSTGPSKVIGRTAGDLMAEIDRYTRIDGVPLRGERIIVLASMVHVLGLVGALLYGLHAGVRLRWPERVAGGGILDAVAAETTPATVLGVPFHIGLMTSVTDPPALPQLRRMTTGGELVPATTAEAFVDRYRVPLGNMWGMTEVGVIATDLFGSHRPALRPAPGLEVVEHDGELLIGRPESPYVGLSDPTRWADGWLHTRDAGRTDPDTGLVTVLGRLDSQISVGGLKVDLTEVEATVTALPEVAEAVVLYDDMITAYVRLVPPATAATVQSVLADRLAGYKLPRRMHVLDALPRTTTGKLVRDGSVLRRAAAREVTE
ncbi:class I adenylate-forming enzyme family protein [Actinophytocola oryzae]|uniref:Acyl-CoA synthetase (AMP-forming)/AMP-acid ligase II n=1 Tax=Actinophytocola oryzae TaxID=502181 RepID=A0A4R7VJV5_9PSEU|nr:fatty acid--CoA ligase family protein [Actinophytocola oryzae]TDV49722.1 acyl-CoA synthetase (AMP-forming)/AMP-acid ligase II [Actinophytocola oryzae]